MNDSPPAGNPPDAPRQPAAVGEAEDHQPRYSFDQMAQGANEVLIDFRGQTYRLRLTRHNKLILNK